MQVAYTDGENTLVKVFIMFVKIYAVHSEFYIQNIHNKLRKFNVTEWKLNISKNQSEFKYWCILQGIQKLYKISYNFLILILYNETELMPTKYIAKNMFT